jgi:hypothetical protein
MSPFEIFALLCDAAAAVTDQAAVLNELYASTNAGAWSDNTGWAAGSDACARFGVGCNAAGIVYVPTRCVAAALLWLLL